MLSRKKKLQIFFVVFILFVKVVVCDKYVDFKTIILRFIKAQFVNQECESVCLGLYCLLYVMIYFCHVQQNFLANSEKQEILGDVQNRVFMKFV